MQIASSPSDFFSVDGFTALQSIVAVLTQQICTTPATTGIATHYLYFGPQHKQFC